MNISPWPKADMRWYLGVRCRKCRTPILFALDRSDGAGGSWLPVGGKLVLTCPLEKCGHQADYTHAVVSRYQKQPANPNEKERVTGTTKSRKRKQ